MNFSLTSHLIGAAGSNVDYGETFSFLWESTGFANLQWGNVVMILIACFFLLLAIKFKFEPLLLVGIAFGMLLSNLPVTESDWIFHPDWWTVQDVDYINVLQHGGLIDILYIGVKTSVYPCLIFLGVGAMTDFEPLLSNPKSLILGAAAQLGIYVAFFLAVCFGFTGPEARHRGVLLYGAHPRHPASHHEAHDHQEGTRHRHEAHPQGHQGGEDPLPHRHHHRDLPLPALRGASARLPDAGQSAQGMRSHGKTQRYGAERAHEHAQNALMNIVTICLSVSVGATAHFSTFLNTKTLLIIVLGLMAFMFATVGGLGIGKLMCWLTKGKINPLIGSAGVSAVPMAARVSNLEGLRAKPGNYLLMHAMGPNVAGVIGSAVAAGFLMAVFGGGAG